MKISIIIPIFNTEGYITACLNSILNQTYENLEILIIDDFSTDNSIKVIEDFQLKDDRIKLIKNTTTLGLAETKNIGINNITGEYFCIIHSDDFIDKNYIEVFVNVLNNNNNLNCICNYKIYKYFGIYNKQNYYAKYKTIFPVYQETSIIHPSIIYMPNYCWCKIYKTSFVKNNNLMFIKDLQFEDIYFNEILKTKLETIYFIENSTYYYTQNPNSLVNLINNKSINILDPIYIIYNIFQYYKKYNYLNHYQLNLVWLKQIFFKQKDPEIFFQEMKKIFLKMKFDILKNQKIYSKGIIKFFNLVINNNYLKFKIKNYLLNNKIFNVFIK